MPQIAKHGRDITLPDLRPLIVTEAGCERLCKMHDPCSAYYVDLTTDEPRKSLT
ncbi:MAG: hypothetical protein JSR72_06980 [Proteobacteria bacterium]|nr:hypothetical protein [Pseudomonadota bacterium]